MYLGESQPKCLATPPKHHYVKIPKNGESAPFCKPKMILNKSGNSHKWFTHYKIGGLCLSPTVHIVLSANLFSTLDTPPPIINTCMAQVLSLVCYEVRHKNDEFETNSFVKRPFAVFSDLLWTAHRHNLIQSRKRGRGRITMVRTLFVRNLRPSSAPRFFWRRSWTSRHYDRIRHPTAQGAACAG